MRLLSFVPCGCRAGPIDDAPPASLQQPADQHHQSTAARRRRRRRARSLSGSPQWRPSLGDIYEEYSAAGVGAGAAAAAKPSGGGRSWPGKTAAARVLPRAHSDEYRHVETAASAPTAFLF